MNELLESILLNLKKQGIFFESEQSYHLAIFDLDTINQLKANEKTYESRWSIRRNRPYNRIKENDVVFIKQSNGPIVAFFYATDINFYEVNGNFDLLIEKYAVKIGSTEERLKLKINSKYVTFMLMNKLKFVEPFNVKKTDCQTWVCFN